MTDQRLKAQVIDEIVSFGRNVTGSSYFDALLKLKKNYIYRSGYNTKLLNPVIQQ